MQRMLLCPNQDKMTHRQVYVSSWIDVDVFEQWINWSGPLIMISKNKASLTNLELCHQSRLIREKSKETFSWLSWRCCWNRNFKNDPIKLQQRTIPIWLKNIIPSVLVSSELKVFSEPCFKSNLVSRDIEGTQDPHKIFDQPCSASIAPNLLQSAMV